VEDYIAPSYVNAVPFNQTDTVPLTNLAIRRMVIEPAISVLTDLPIAARAVNILR
jgi:hypothetical protein